MYPIQGTWFGEYTINHGTYEDPDIKWFHFELRIKGDEEEFTGRFFDKTLISQESIVHGFLENDFISFVREASQDSELKEAFSFNLENEEKKIEIHFAGNFNTKEDGYIGNWELEVQEEREGLQESGISEYRTGNWYMRKL